MRSRSLCLVLCLCMILSICPGVYAQNPQDITDDTIISGSGYNSFGFLSDKNIKSYKTSKGDAVITLENDAGMGSIYLLFDLEYSEYTIENQNGKTITAGGKGFLHEYIDLTAAFSDAPTSITIRFSDGKVRLSEIYVFSVGEPPDFVQKWDAPLDDGADILLFSTHGDDEQLFFAGLLPCYAAEKNARVQVVYLTDHRNLNKARTHEMLNGLWAVGVKAYPVFGKFMDFRIDSLQGTYDEYAAQGVSETDLLKFVVEQLRRFKPLVAVGHDIEGEYGHGMHMVYTDTLIKALDVSNDADAFPELAQQYGTWDVPKTYLHLYGENEIKLDYDRPLDAFGGMTAFEVTQKLGYPCHESQQRTWFTDWLNGSNGEITKAAQIETYNPCNFGLYRTTVGADVQKNDFLENVTTYAEQERIEQEGPEQSEPEQPEQEQLTQGGQEVQATEQLNREPVEQESTPQGSNSLPVVLGIIAAVSVLGLMLILIRQNARRKCRH